MNAIKHCAPHLMTLLVIAAGSIAWWQATLGFKALTWETYRRLQVESRPLAVPNVTFEDHRGRAYDLHSLRGKVVVVNFIYTRCPTICGYTGLAFARLQTAIEQRGYGDRVRLLSVSLDPQHDTPHYLTQYLRRFTAHADGPWRTARPVNGRDDQLLLQRLGVVSIADGMGGINHNAATHVIDTTGRLVRIIDEGNIGQALDSIELLLNIHRAGLHDAV